MELSFSFGAPPVTATEPLMEAAASTALTLATTGASSGVEEICACNAVEEGRSCYDQLQECVCWPEEATHWQCPRR